MAEAAALVRRRDRGCRFAGDGDCYGRLELEHDVEFARAELVGELHAIGERLRRLEAHVEQMGKACAILQRR
jgi:hypothetical protein